jgi:hypothetical protein
MLQIFVTSENRSPVHELDTDSALRLTVHLKQPIGAFFLWQERDSKLKRNASDFGIAAQLKDTNCVCNTVDITIFDDLLKTVPRSPTTIEPCARYALRQDDLSLCAWRCKECRGASVEKEAVRAR